MCLEQELGGDVLFPCRIGFSGTPSDLLPVEMGRCAFERGDDGRIVHTLTSPSAMRVGIVAAGWTVGSLLRRVATSQPPFHALIGERASPIRRDLCQCTEASVGTIDTGSVLGVCESS